MSGPTPAGDSGDVMTSLHDQDTTEPECMDLKDVQTEEFQLQDGSSRSSTKQSSASNSPPSSSGSTPPLTTNIYSMSPQSQSTRKSTTKSRPKRISEGSRTSVSKSGQDDGYVSMKKSPETSKSEFMMVESVGSGSLDDTTEAGMEDINLERLNMIMTSSKIEASPSSNLTSTPSTLNTLTSPIMMDLPLTSSRVMSATPTTRTSPITPSTRTSPLTTPSMSFKRQHGKMSNPGTAGYWSEFSVASSASATDKRSKRRSWINSALNPTYNTRCEDLRRNFPGLPPTEILLGDYSCALQKDILVHGRMYITTTFLCFYANIWKWETAVTVRWKEVSAMTKEKTALVIPNAIQICSGNEKLFFCSFTVRDKAHVNLFKVWQNALLDSPASENELLSWAHQQYGDRAPSSAAKSDVEYDMSNDGGSNHSYDGLEPVMRQRLYSNIQEETNEENKLAINEGSFLPDIIGDKPLRALSKKSESLPTDMSDNSESDNSPLMKADKRKSLKSDGHTATLRPGIVSTDILTYEAWRQTKLAKEVLNSNFSLNIDDLFTLLFTNSKFFYDFQAERKTFDIVQCPWQASQDSDEKFRKVEFTLNLNHAMGPRTSRATEVQTMRANSVPGHIYNVDVDTTNADIPYAEYFSVLSHYCIVKVTDTESRLTVLCDIKYKKSPWGIVKSFIDKNVWAGIDEHFSALAAALQREIADMRRMKEHHTSKDVPVGVTALGAAKKKMRKQRARKISVTESASGMTSVHSSKFGSLRGAQGGGVALNTVDIATGSGSLDSGSGMNLMLVCFLVMFCVLNILLLYKFWCLEQQVVTKIDLYDKYHMSEYPSGSDLPKSTSDWLSLIRKQELKHAKDLEAWQHAVSSAADLLKQTENAMSMFSRSFHSDTNRKLLKHFLSQQGLADSTLDDSKSTAEVPPDISATQHQTLPESDEL